MPMTSDTIGATRNRYRLGARLASSWLRTHRFVETGARHRDACDAGYILAVPHGSLLMIAARYRGTGLITMASRSADGTFAAMVLERLGLTVVRGSTSNGATAGLRGMVRVADERETPLLGLTVDGPRGPAWRVQPGVVALARWTGLPILPALAGGPGLTLPTWDRLRVPIPFARCWIAYGQPVAAGGGVSDDAACDAVERELVALRRNGGCES